MKTMLWLVGIGAVLIGADKAIANYRDSKLKPFSWSPGQS